MSFQKISQSNMMKSALLVLFVASTLLFASPGEAKAFSGGIGGAPVSITINSGQDVYTPGQNIAVNFAGSNGGSWRYVYVYITLNGVSFDTNTYFNGVGMTYGTWNLTAPATPGNYTVSFNIAGDSYTGVFSLSVACPSGTAWNGSSCVAPAPVAWISQDTNPTTANLDGTGQTFTVNWGVSSGSATSCTVSKSSPVAGLSAWSSGLSGPQTASPGVPGQHYWQVVCTGPGGNSNTASFTHTVVCPSGSVQSGTSCVALTPTGTISASPNTCTVSSGASACTSNISWSTSNTPNATVTIGASTFASGTSGSQAAPWISPNGPGVFILKDNNGNQLGSVSVNAVCTSGTSWVNGVCAAPTTASISVSPTSIAYGGQTLISWSSTNATSCAASGQWSNSGTLSGSGWSNPLTTNTTFYFQCTGPGGTSALQSATVSVAGAPAGSISASPNPCTVASGASACTSNISWSTTNTPSATVTIGAQTFASGTSGSQAASWISPSGPGVFILKDSNGNQLGSVSVNAVCTSGTSWVGGVCATTTTPSGNISPNSCTISSGASSCAMNVVWNSANTTGTVTVQRGYSPFGTIASGPSGNQSFTFAPPGTFALNLLDGATQLGSANFTASCAAGSTWNGSSCAANACSNGANNPTACNTCTSPQLWNGTSCVAPASCSLPWGGSIADGQSTTAYQTSSVTSPTTCASVSQTRTCSNGTLSGSYTNSGCTAGGASCSLPWGGSITDGVSVTAFQTPSVTSPATCASDPSQTRTCSNGTLSGSYTNQNCTALSPTATISATPVRVRSGTVSTISWNATDVTSCTESGPGLAGSSKTGSQSVTVTAQSTYTITCQTSGSPITSSATVNVVPGFQEF